MSKIVIGANIVDPRDALPNLTAWYSAGSGHVKSDRATNVPVPSWRNLAQGSGGVIAQLTSSGTLQPTYGGNYQQHPPMSFSGTLGQNIGVSSIQWPTARANFLVVVKLAGTNSTFMAMRNLASGIQYMDVAGTSLRAKYGTEIYTAPAGTVTGALQYVRFEASASAYLLQTEGSSTTGVPAAAVDFSAGANQTIVKINGIPFGTAYDNHEIHDVFIYSSDMTPTEWGNMVAWMNAKYGQSWTGA